MAVLVFAIPAAIAAQRPTPAQAQQLLRERPDLVAQLRQRIGASGLSPEQVRERLRAEGYPENLLDAYLSGTPSLPGASVPSEDVLRAVRALGVVDSLDFATLDSLRRQDTTATRRQGRRGETDSLETARRDSMAADSGLTIFGLDLFRASSSQFEPNLAGPVDANYRLGPGDQLVLILTGDVEEAHSLDVTREGFVVIPQVGRLNVNNLTLGQLESLLYDRLGRVYSGVRRGPGATTQFSISVARLRSNQIYVTGDVQRPGSYRVSSAGTAMTALYAAGGPTENGSLRRVEVRRGGQLVGSLDVYDYLLRGDASADVRLLNGDVLFVPVAGLRVRVVGEVVRPATYELQEDEGLGDLVRMAGGFRPTASQQRIQIERVVPAAQRTVGGRDRVVIDVTGPQLAAGATGIPLAAGDVVRVFEVAERVRNRIIVRGNVWSPGPQGLAPESLLSDALRRAGGVKPDTYLGQVLVSRLRPDSTREQLRAMLADTTGAVVNDFALREDDEIEVFSVMDFRPERYVAIAGAVRKPGRYPYRVGMTLRDLVLQAGGVEQSADLREAEVARLPEDRSNGQTAQTLRVPLDSTYLFERGPDGTYLGPPGIAVPRTGSTEIALLPYDNVLILRQPDWQLQRSVVLGGEVRFPGTYSLATKSERLGDVIRRAGGLTPEAYAQGIRFYRRQDEIGRVGVDLPAVLRSARDRDNLLLEDGDSIFIPQYTPVVIVQGAVNSPVALTYEEGRSLDWYIERAGGGSRTADLRRAYVTQPNGIVESRPRRFSFRGAPEPRAGSVVTVPERDPAERRDPAQVAGTIAQILASLVAIIAVTSR